MEKTNLYQVYLMLVGYISESEDNDDIKETLKNAVLELYKATVNN